jgi:hypothetical protein
MRMGVPMEACLDKYPEHRERLRPLLEVAQRLETPQPDPKPSAHFLANLETILTTESNRTPKGGEVNRKRQ